MADSYAEYYGGSGVNGQWLSGPVSGAAMEKLVVYFGDNFAADIEINIPDGVDVAECTAVMAMSMISSPHIGLQKDTSISQDGDNSYVRFVLVPGDYLKLKPGRYYYDIEVKTASNTYGTKVSSTVDIKETFVRQ